MMHNSVVDGSVTRLPLGQTTSGNCMSAQNGMCPNSDMHKIFKIAKYLTKTEYVQSNCS